MSLAIVSFNGSCPCLSCQQRVPVKATPRSRWLKTLQRRHSRGKKK